jgi:hypothetical protein
MSSRRSTLTKKPDIASSATEEPKAVGGAGRKIKAKTKKSIEVWDHILKMINYKDESLYFITNKEIKNTKKGYDGEDNQFEPRILCYQTSSDSRPKSFIEKGICILPVKNGLYCLVKENIYYTLAYSDVTPTIIPKNTDSLLLSIGQSETSTIDNLRYAGVFEREEILGEPILYGPILNGRHRTHKFSFTIGSASIDVEGVQYEIDSCYETKNKILLIEGKSGEKEINSFNIRQLYFPYRVLLDNPANNKQIVCGFVHQLKKNNHIWLFTFEDKLRMDSIKLMGHYVYKFSS